jgi:hypothetical protein
MFGELTNAYHNFNHTCREIRRELEETQAMSVDTKTERVIFIEYQHGRPFTVITTENEGRCRNYYDVEWCERDRQLYYRNSGSGGYTRPIEVDARTTFWAAPDVPLVVAEGATRRKRADGKKAFERVLNGDWTVSKFSEGRCEYCQTCDDYLPCEDIDELCEHCWYCGESDDWSKPGERCPWECEECREYGRETKPPPPMVVLARGYGMAASELGSLARRLLDEHGFTVASLAERFGCDEWTEGIAMALRGEVHPDATRYRLETVALVMGLDTAERDELVKAFEES